MWTLCVISAFALIFVGCYANIRELIPLEPPENLTLIDFDDKDVIIKWEPINPESVRGTFRGYIVRIWNHAWSQVYAIAPDITRTSVQFFPFSRNFITVAVRNDKYVGPRSAAISFDAPQTEPNMLFLFDFTQLGSSSVLLQWNSPTQPNGVLLGYNIYCSEMNGLTVNEKTTVKYFVTGANNYQAKLTGLKQGIKYMVEIGAVNCAGESEHKTVELELTEHTTQPPSMSTFKYKIDYNLTDKDQLIKEHCSETSQFVRSSKTKRDDLVDDFYILHEQEKGKIVTPTPTREWPAEYSPCFVNTLIKWIPDVTKNPGEHFYIKYRTKGQPEFVKTSPQLEEDYAILEKFNACVNYEIILVTVDGEFETESELQETPAVIFMYKY